MLTGDKPSTELSQILSQDFVTTRQPLFDKELAVYAYELLIESTGCASDKGIQQQAGLKTDTILEELRIAEAGALPGKIVFTRVPPERIADRSVYALPPERIIIKVLASDFSRNDLLEQIQELITQNYAVAIEIDSVHPRFIQIVNQISFAIIPFTTFQGLQVAKLVKLLKPYTCQLVAANIATWEMYSGAKFLGFNYFQGCFFATADIEPGSKIKTLPAIKMRLLKELSCSDDDIDLSKISETLALDTSLCINLLKFINSAAFCLPNKVDSISRAISFLGISQLKQWAMVSLMADMDKCDKGREVMQASLHRAFFLSLLSDTGFINYGSKDSMFMMGLLSLADAIFGIKIDNIISELPIESYMQDALMQKEGSPLTGIVKLLKCIEVNDWQTGGEILDYYTIPRFTAAKLYMAASQMAGEALSPQL